MPKTSVELADGRLFAIPLVEHIGIKGLLASRASGEREASLQKWLTSR